MTNWQLIIKKKLIYLVQTDKFREISKTYNFQTDKILWKWYTLNLMFLKDFKKPINDLYMEH